MGRRIFLLSLAGSGELFVVQRFWFFSRPVTVPIVCELSGPGAPSGMRWERGVLMAAEDINASGGILGRKIETFSLDTKTEAPVSVAAMRKAIESKPFVVMGPVYSGSAIACMGVLRDAGVPQFVGSESPSITAARQPQYLPDQLQCRAQHAEGDQMADGSPKGEEYGDCLRQHRDGEREGEMPSFKLLEPKGGKDRC